MHDEITNYISDARGYGLKDDQIKQHLLDAGWELGEVTEAFRLESERTAFNHPQEIRSQVIEKQVVEEPRAVEQPKKRRLRLYIVIALAIFVALAGLFYFALFQNIKILGFSAFEFFLNSAAKHMQNANVKSFELVYSDPENFSSGELGNGLGAVTLKNLEAKISSKSFRDSKDASEGSTTFTFKNDNNNYSGSLEYRYIKEDLYFKISEDSQQAFVTQLLNSSYKADTAGQWLALKLTGYKEQLDNKVNGAELAKNLLNSKTLVPNFEGFEKINGQYSLHYVIKVNKTELSNLLAQQLPVNDSAPSQLISSEQKEAIDQLVKNLDFGSLEIWIGFKDLAFKKISFKTDAPSLASLAEQLVKNYTVELAKVNDNKRIADVKQVSSALELFYNDNKGYPEGINGVPQDFVPKYLPAMPQTAPASGNCTDYHNTYWYKHQGEPKTSAKGIKVYPSYTFTFCLGFDTANFKAGFGLATPSGITTTVACPDPVHPCFLDQSRQNTNPDNFGTLLSRVKYTGQLSWTYQPEVSKENKTIAVPEGVMYPGSPGYE